MKYIDADILQNEIERLSKIAHPCDNHEQNIGFNDALYNILSFLDTLQEPSLPSNLDEAAAFDKVWKSEDCSNILDEGERLTSNFKELFKEVCESFYQAGAEWMAGQFERVEGEPVDWYENGEGKQFCHGIDTNQCLEWQGFYIRKK